MMLSDSSALESFGEGLLTASAQGGLLAIALIAVRLSVGRRIASWWYAAGWSIVALRLLVPVAIASPVGVWSHIPALEQAVSDESPRADASTSSNVRVLLRAPQEWVAHTVGPSQVTAAGHLHVEPVSHSWLERAAAPDAIAAPDGPAWASLQPTALSTEFNARAASPAVIEQPAQHTPYTTILMWAWGMGVLVVSGVIACRARSLRRVIARSIPAPRSIAVLAKDCAGIVGVKRRVRVLISSDVHAPFVTGVRSPIIVLPADCEHAYARTELRCVLIHELTHAKRLDIAMGWAGAAAVALHWFNPLAWVAVWLWNIDRERACDAAAVRALGARHTREYGLTLIKAAVRASSPRHGLTLAAAFGPERTSEMTRRIELLPQARRGSRLGKVTLAAGLVALASVTVTGATDSTKEQAEAVSQLQEVLKAVKAGEQIKTEEIAMLAAQLAQLREQASVDTEGDGLVVEHEVANEDEHSFTTFHTIKDAVEYKVEVKEDADKSFWIIHRSDETGDARVVLEQMGSGSFEILESDADDETQAIILNDAMEMFHLVKPPAPASPRALLAPTPPRAPAFGLRGQGEGNVIVELDGQDGRTFVYRTPSLRSVDPEEILELHAPEEFAVLRDLIGKEFEIDLDFPARGFRFELQPERIPGGVQQGIQLRILPELVEMLEGYESALSAEEVKKFMQVEEQVAQRLMQELRNGSSDPRSRAERARAVEEMFRASQQLDTDLNPESSVKRIQLAQKMYELEMQMRLLRESMERVQKEMESLERGVEKAPERPSPTRRLPTRTSGPAA